MNKTVVLARLSVEEIVGLLDGEDGEYLVAVGGILTKDKGKFVINNPVCWACASIPNRTRNRGLYAKYTILKKNEDSNETPQYRAYFILRLDSEDPIKADAAQHALLEYAQRIGEHDFPLSNDLKRSALEFISSDNNTSQYWDKCIKEAK